MRSWWDKVTKSTGSVWHQSSVIDFVTQLDSKLLSLMPEVSPIVFRALQTSTSSGSWVLLCSSAARGSPSVVGYHSSSLLAAFSRSRNSASAASK
ncbi:hypothetical protein PM082_024340 [Marasmius tenuissimus]|nr:hypothetical protein PM082_024340 [Marasmius tenuissimus]